MFENLKGEQGTCPYCKSNDISYSDFELTDNGGFYASTCNNCGANYQEWYDLMFSANYGIEKEVEND